MVNRTQTVWKPQVVELHVYNGTTYIQIWRPGRYLKPTLFAADEYMGNNHKKIVIILILKKNENEIKESSMGI